MNTKMKTKTGIGIALVVLMVAALAAPVSAEYVAEDTKMNIYQNGTGNLSYIYGEPFYQCIWGYDSAGNSDTATYNIDLSSIPDLAKLIEDGDIEARLYVYWTWPLVDMCEKATRVSTYKDYAVYPELEVEINDVPVSFDYADGTNWIDNYTDSKKIETVGLEYNQPGYVAFNFPSGTNCSTIPIDELLQSDNTVNVTNVYPYRGPEAGYCPTGYVNGTGRCKVCIQGVGLLLIYPQVSDNEYWIAEGNDMTYVLWNPAPCDCELNMTPPPPPEPPGPHCDICTSSGYWSYGITPEMATTKVTFTGKVDEKMSKATLTSVIPAGSSPYNRLYFNNFFNYWGGLWTGLPSSGGNLAVSKTVVTANLCVRDSATNVNVAGFQNGLYPPYPLYPEKKEGEKQMNVAGAFLVVEK